MIDPRLQDYMHVDMSPVPEIQEHTEYRKTKIFVLIDCNNFFVSCERIFRPELATTPVLVLSSNDGCAIARSNEVKALGIPMGAPAFKYRDIIERHKIVKFSANFELYGDISRRIVTILKEITPRIEVYSVDESFLDITSLDIPDYTSWAKKVRARVLRDVGVPVSLGIAQSKTLCKIATEIAKNDPTTGGVMRFMGLDGETTDAHLNMIPIGDVWGVGRQLTPQLKAASIHTALKLKYTNPRFAQQLMGIHGRQMVAELQGQPCIPLESFGHERKSISRGRTFGEDTTAMHVLEAAIASLTAQAAFRLREDSLATTRISLFVCTDRHKPGYQAWVREVKLATPSSDTGFIIQTLVQELGEIYSSRQHYHKLMVSLNNFVPANALQTDILGYVDQAGYDKARSRMAALDAINQRWGRGKLYYAAENLSKTWQPKHQVRSPRYVSDWNELPAVTIYSNDPSSTPRQIPNHLQASRQKRTGRYPA